VAQRALPPGTAQRRSFFGLLDADGWSAATLKALIWFVIIMFTLAYLPNVAYYFAVGETVDLGANIISPINLCDPANETLPCPAPRGAVVPWQASPKQLALPAPRSDAAAFQSGVNIYLVGGSTADGPSASVLASTVTPTGNLSAWSEGQALPEPRADAALVLVNAVPYVIGGLGADGKPASTVFVGSIDKGMLMGWTAATDLALPVAVSGASAVVDQGGVWLIGGRTADGLSSAVYRSTIDATAKPPKLGAWKERPEVQLHTADGTPNGRADAVAANVNDFIYLVGGQTTLGPTGEMLRLHLDAKGEPVKVSAASDAAVQGWGAGLGEQSLPAIRVNAGGFANNGVVYVLGGLDGSGTATTTMYWAVPDSTSGDIGGWQLLDVDHLPAPSAGSAALVAGAYAFNFGGSDGHVAVAGSSRAYMAPKQPFFRLGLIGMTIPGLAIHEEIGVQIGEILSATLGLIMFVGVMVVGVLVHRPRTRARFLRWVSRGRYRAPLEDDPAS
jgi:N-acetylneuraminic acid mutarotase